MISGGMVTWALARASRRVSGLWVMSRIGLCVVAVGR
jgi:hypothetical protein